MISSTFLTLTALAFPLHAFAVNIRPHQSYVRRAGAATDEILAGAPVNNITVTADNVFQCSDATISWTGAVPPVTLMIGLGGYYVGTTDLSTIPDLPTSPYSWTVDTSVGSDMIFQITDANGEMGYIQNIKVAGGTNSSCLATVTSSNTAWTSSTSPVAAQAATSSAADDGSDGYAAATSSGGSNGVGAVASATSSAYSAANTAPAASSKGAAAVSASATSKPAVSSSASNSTSSASHLSPPTLLAASSSSHSSSSSAKSATLAAASSTSSVSGASRIALGAWGPAVLAVAGLFLGVGLI